MTSDNRTPIAREIDRLLDEGADLFPTPAQGDRIAEVNALLTYAAGGETELPAWRRETP